MDYELILPTESQVACYLRRDMEVRSILFADRLPEEAAELGRLAQLLKEDGSQVRDVAASVLFAMDVNRWWSTDHTDSPDCVCEPTDLVGVCEGQPIDVVNEAVAAHVEDLRNVSDHYAAIQLVVAGTTTAPAQACPTCFIDPESHQDDLYNALHTKSTELAFALAAWETSIEVTGPRDAPDISELMQTPHM